MKRYVNCYREKTYGYYYGTAEEARQVAEPSAYAVAVEIELPDPPHEWKVGDWYWLANEPGFYQIGFYQIVAPAPDGKFHVLHHIVPKERVVLLQNVEMGYNRTLGATPCDPPAWFTEDGGAS